MSQATPPINHALSPVPESSRVFGLREHASLWFSLGVGLLVMQVGAYLVPATGIREAVWATFLGSLLGAALLAWVGKIGCDTGLSSAGLMHRTYGTLFARLPVLLNIVQLLGWTIFEMVVMREGSVAIVGQALGLELSGATATLVATLFWGLVLAALLAGSMLTLVRKFVSHYGLPLVVLSLLWLSWQFGDFLAENGWAQFWNRPGDGSMTMFGALDLVIAMPVSWLPLVADYARHGRSGRTAFAGIWFGYAIANMWCYALGVMVISSVGPDTNMVNALLLAQGGLIALGLILIDELDNAYGDLYSGSVSAHSLLPKWSIRRWGMGLALVSTALALVLPMHTLEPFLLTLSSVFVPLYGVILGRNVLGGARRTPEAKTLHLWPALLWLLGIAFYHSIGQWAPGFGSALPTLLLTFLVALLTRPRASPSGAQVEAC
ncbi:cytosine permease [Pusillimonas sp. CC-YST705]|uniref:Cytosine permease n=1 Tax=Mesopusillimonas faecipullorum TaxID=2755040 RepID=A0ABS8CAB2_9BURK|nr:cytosine permease [Mesopusillimonas faecipullorum]MCB5362792.1 cytosine permease [Mesopusillimonas faecipullorum]